MFQKKWIAPLQTTIPVVLGIIFVLSVVFAFIITTTNQQTASAAACGSEPASSTGKVTQNISVPSTGTYTIWSRLKAPDTNPVEYKVYVSGECFTIGQRALTPNTLTWVDYENGSTSDKATINLSAGTHALVLTAGSEALELDRVLFLSDSCVPTGVGTNCENDTTAPATALTAPANGATVSGATTITATATDNDAIDRVEFYRGSTLIGSDSSSPYQVSWDTTAVSNGSYSLTSRAYDLSNNMTTSTARTVTVNNPTPVNAVISSFTASPTTIINGQSSTLSWVATAGQNCSINQGVGSVGLSGSRLVSPTSDTVYTLSCQGIHSGNNASRTASITIDTSPPADQDDDGIADAIEDSGPNSGDANYDGVLDSEQPHVATFRNTQTNDYNTIVIDEGCDLSAVQSLVSNSSHPFGAWRMNAHCAATTATIYLHDVHDFSQWQIHKVNTSLEQSSDITGQVTIENITLGGAQTTTLSYSLVDGGELDEDDTVNGVIVDPVAIYLASSSPQVPTNPQQPAQSTPSLSAPNTGIGVFSDYTGTLYGVILTVGSLVIIISILSHQRKNKRK